jgi:hypothetical protein
MQRIRRLAASAVGGIATLAQLQHLRARRRDTAKRKSERTWRLPPPINFEICDVRFTPKADIKKRCWDVRYVLKADITLIPKTAYSTMPIQDMARRLLSRLGRSDLRRAPTVRYR